MGLFRRKKTELSDPPPVEHVAAKTYKPVGAGDLTVISQLSTELKKSGAIGRPEEDKSVERPQESFQDLFSEAAAAAKYEDELNPDFHHPEVEAIVAERQAQQLSDWDNPNLDGVDDYGHQVYQDKMTAGQRARLLADDEDDELDFMVNNGRTI